MPLFTLNRFCIAVSFAVCASLSAFGATTKPASLAGKTCTDAGCHDSYKKNKYVHGPTAIDSCGSCHKLTDESTHTFAFSRNEKELCATCHMQMARKKVKHSPAAMGTCVACHDPHSSSNEYLLKSKPDELCVTCHDDNTLFGGKKNHHGPVEAKVCTSCHEPHDSDYSHLLVAPERQLCTSCHNDVVNASMVSVHSPVQQQCTSCHNGHSSNEDHLLVAARPQLCYNCHENQRLASKDAKYKHDAALSEHGCNSCHEPHGSTYPTLAKKPQEDLCLDCHASQKITADGRAIPSMKAAIKNSKVKHGPIRDNGNCSDCHDVHGSVKPRLLVKAYPLDFYTKFSEEKYALCLSCHDSQLATRPQTTTATGFRNGTRNLHYLHVNKDTKGRTCGVCHASHGSNNQRMIRTTVKFGEWDLPIAFAKTKTGGSCEPGCHLARGYDRENPVDYSKPYTRPESSHSDDLENIPVAPIR